MRSEGNILEIPIDKTKDINALVNWFESVKLPEKKQPKIFLSHQSVLPTLVVMGLVVLIGMALVKLEEKGKLQAKHSGSKKKSADFLTLIKSSTTEKKLERLIEKRYDIDLILHIPHHGSHYSKTTSVHHPSTSKYSLDDVFGIWKNKNINLDKVREDQWGKRN